MDKQDKTRVIQIRLDNELLNKFNDITTKYSVNKSALIRSWIEKYVKAHEKEG